MGDFIIIVYLFEIAYHTIKPKFFLYPFKNKLVGACIQENSLENFRLTVELI